MFLFVFKNNQARVIKNHFLLANFFGRVGVAWIGGGGAWLPHVVSYQNSDWNNPLCVYFYILDIDTQIPLKNISQFKYQ